MPTADEAHAHSQDVDAVLARFLAARDDYFDLRLTEVAAAVRAKIPAADTIGVDHAFYDYDGVHVHVRRAVSAGGQVLADLDSADDASAALAEEIAEEIDAVLDALAEYGLRPEGDNPVIILPADATVPTTTTTEDNQ
ncbi:MULTISPECIES: hypothetical protein [Frankia]|uniref:hypothetical protein n=1 Tax=Frankia TaxID=1854 RepID=UPI0006EBF08D|nr:MULTISPECIES: hypothetical protein [Frankia]